MSRANLVVSTVSMLGLVGLAACASGPQQAAEASELEAYQQAIAEASRPASPEDIARAERSDPLTRANFWAEEYRKNSGDLETIVAFMGALRAIGSHDRVSEVAAKALPVYPQSHEILLELGRSLMAENKPAEAAQAFVRSADFAPEDDAAPLAALGVAFDQIEQHQKAQQAYEYALARDPDRPSTLSNYGLSLALSGNLDQAEAQLRKANALPNADVRVRQNLALILGLQGRFDEMIEIDPSAPRRTIEANKQALRDMMIPARDYSTLSADPIESLDVRRSDPMPAVETSEMAEDEMPDLAENQASDTGTEGLSGGPSEGVQLRPKLRGAQSG